MTVENAIAIAGGFTPRAAKDKVTITRKVQGEPSRFVLKKDGIPLQVMTAVGTVPNLGSQEFHPPHWPQ
jgi:protein involved in polysaccharide export with SLBB domain